MKISDYDYSLPEELIAQFPPAVRGSSRLLVLYNGHIEHRRYSDLATLVRPGDLVVLNDTKVIKARLLALNEAGQERELLLLESHAENNAHHHKVLYGGKIRAGDRLTVNGTVIGVEAVEDGGLATIGSTADLLELAAQAGQVPLPPYMRREATPEDTERYQTVFARQAGSVAAPTASLNFTNELAERISARGTDIAYLTLHVGLGTFLPIRGDNVKGHVMHSEYFIIPAETADKIRRTKQNGGRVIAVGTTVARTLEYAAAKLLASGEPLTGEADIFIYPGYKFKLVDALLTNFHAPRSTVLMLAAAFAGWDNLKRAYEAAIDDKYAFLSFGDSMFIG